MAGPCRVPALLISVQEERQQVLFRVFLPPVDGDFAVSHVGPENESVGPVLPEPVEEEVGAGDGHAAHGDHRGSVVEGRGDVFFALDAAAEVYGERCGGGDFAQHTDIDDVLRLGPVEVDDVQPAEAQPFKLPGHLCRAVAVDGLLSVVALCESHALALYDVDGGDEFYALCHGRMLFVNVEKVAQDALARLSALFGVELTGIEVALVQTGTVGLYVMGRGHGVLA